MGLAKCYAVSGRQHKHADEKDPDQTAWMSRLIWAFVIRIHDRYFSHKHGSNGSRQAKKCLRACVICADSGHPAHAQSIIRSLARHSYILQ